MLAVRGGASVAEKNNLAPLVERLCYDPDHLDDLIAVLLEGLLLNLDRFFENIFNNVFHASLSFMCKIL